MVSGRISGRTAGCDLLALIHHIADFDEILGIMCVQCRQTVSVINYDIVAVAVMTFGNDDRTAVSRIARRTVCGGNINTVMELGSAG